jgi:hypothetical protein
MSDDTGKNLAARYGVHVSLIKGIKAGRAWKEYTNTNPFAGLMR